MPERPARIVCSLTGQESRDAAESGDTRDPRDTERHHSPDEWVSGKACW